MNVLIICTYFPPDSAVAAVRPYMLAKYMSEFGHKVIVLRSGEIDHKIDYTFREEEQSFRIISFLAHDLDTNRGKTNGMNSGISAKYRFSKLPPLIRKTMSKTKKCIMDPFDTIRELREVKHNFSLQKAIIDKLTGEHFDIVFSTYADLENYYAGEYASNKLNAKWIMDFRDPIVWYSEKSKWTWNIFASIIQKKALRKADLYTCVSEGLRETLINKNKPLAEVVTMYNGFEGKSIENTDISRQSDDILYFCYTGQFYEMRVSALEAFIDSLSILVKNHRIKKNKIRFVYAGNGSEIISSVLSRYGLLEILEDHGFVDRSEAQKLQYMSDVFLVLSWNTKKSQGVLTGKFYEGIRAGKPIISVVVGELPNSELLCLNNIYNYGFCYETSQEKVMKSDFLDFLEKLYNIKQKNKRIEFSQSTALVEKFRYDNIAKQFENYCKQLCSNT